MKRFYRYPSGAQFVDGVTTFSLWAPGAESVELVLYGSAAGKAETRLALQSREDGFHSAQLPGLKPGDRYRYLVNSGQLVPDPASRFQPEDVHGPSEIVDPRSYEWQQERWNGISWEECVLYELHLGTFTGEGTFAAAEKRLSHLRQAGITAVELMPVSDFSGRRNWGYDGVLPYAPDSSYGRPEELKRFIDAAHGLGMAVFLDVVYNHFGPDGNYLWFYAPDFFTHEVSTPWGDAIDFRKAPVRDLFIHNALYWLEEYFIDGLRLDAVHAIHDPSDEHFLNQLARTVHSSIAGGRQVHLVLENDRNESRYLDPGSANGFTAQWNDDFHHVAHCLATGESGGYYADFAADGRMLLERSLAEGFVFQGESSPFRGGETRGEPSAELPPTAFVNFLQNHDQVGNRAFGERLTQLGDPPLIELLICIQCLAPHIPMLFMGEEFGATVPFQYFCDFHDELAAAVREGRRREFASFPQFRDPEARSRIPDPNASETFARSKLRWEELDTDAGAARLELYRSLFAVRCECLVGRMGGAKILSRDAASEFEVVHLTWALADGSLWSVCYNLSGRGEQMPGADDPGVLVFAHPAGGEGELAAGRVPARTVAAFRREGGDDS